MLWTAFPNFASVIKWGRRLLTQDKKNERFTLIYRELRSPPAPGAANRNLEQRRGTAKIRIFSERGDEAVRIVYAFGFHILEVDTRGFLRRVSEALADD